MWLGAGAVYGKQSAQQLDLLRPGNGGKRTLSGVDPTYHSHPGIRAKLNVVPTEQKVYQNSPMIDWIEQTALLD